MTRRGCLIALAALVACKKQAPARRYAVRGRVVSVDAAGKTANIDAEKIDGWMDAMTMDYPVPDAADLAKLTPGARITGVVEVRELEYALKDVRVVK